MVDRLVTLRPKDALVQQEAECWPVEEWWQRSMNASRMDRRVVREFDTGLRRKGSNEEVGATGSLPAAAFSLCERTRSD
jgi:hypothetical protein